VFEAIPRHFPGREFVEGISAVLTLRVLGSLITLNETAEASAQKTPISHVVSNAGLVFRIELSFHLSQ